MSSMPTYKYAFPSDTEANWNASTYIIPNGIFIWVTDVKKFKVGDGVHKFSELEYANSIKSLTGAGSASVTDNGNGEYVINVSGTGGDMLQANYQTGTGEDNTTSIVDHAQFADNAAHADNADSATHASSADSAGTVTGVRSFALFPVGFVCDWPTNSAPSHTLLCNGQAVSRNTYADLFNVIGTRFGAGNGSSTFNVPNFKGRVSVGYDTSNDKYNSVGKTGGSQTHTHNIQLPVAYTNGYPAFVGEGAYKILNSYSGTSQSAIVRPLTYSNLNTTLESGLLASYTVTMTSENVQPYITMNKIIVY